MTSPKPAPYRDSSGRTMTDYWRPSVAVDTAVLTVEHGLLQVVLTTDEVPARLPGTFLHEGTLLKEAVQRSLSEKVGLPLLKPQQLLVFDALTRDPRYRVLSVAHLAVVRSDQLPQERRFRLVPVAQAKGLPFDHDDIVVEAWKRLRERYRERADPDGLLAAEFTFRELHEVHEAIDAEGTKKMDAFRETMKRQVVPTGRSTSGGVGKPAQLFTLRAS